MSRQTLGHSHGASHAGIDTLLAGMLVAAAVASAGWWWSARHAPNLPSGQEPWEQVKEAYPPVPDSQATLPRQEGLIQSVTRANPFSPQRRQAPPVKGAGTQGSDGSAPIPDKPRFAFKGRVLMGTRERAVLEDLTAGKTHFLEVGQEVAGFKLLDIGEKRVVLSDLQSKEEIEVSLTPAVSSGTSGSQTRQAGSP